MMNRPQLHPLTIDGRDASHLRGDPITGDRYTSRDFMQREWDHMWTRIWHVAGRTAELEEAGDYIVHDFMNESVFCVKQADGGIKAFYNACRHRGMRLVNDSAAATQFQCPYHGWIWGQDGVLAYAQDAHDFPQGDPCGKLKLKELRCDVWGGFVWYTMDDNAPSLLDYLSPMPEVYKNYPMDTAVRVFWMKVDLNTNWKFATDNFSESYHTRTAHPQVPPWIDQDSYPDYETKAMQGWLDLKAAKRRLWKDRGYVHYEHMSDEEITDSPHTVMFPNVTISFLPDNLIFFRTEPHPTDPNKCTFDLWCMAFPVAGQTVVESIMAGPQPLREAEMEHRAFDNGRGVPEIEGQIVYQDMMLAEGQQRGMHSRGYDDAYLSGQETRVRFFHEVLNDYLEGRR